MLLSGDHEVDGEGMIFRFPLSGISLLYWQGRLYILLEEKYKTISMLLFYGYRDEEFVDLDSPKRTGYTASAIFTTTFHLCVVVFSMNTCFRSLSISKYF